MMDCCDICDQYDECFTGLYGNVCEDCNENCFICSICENIERYDCCYDNDTDGELAYCSVCCRRCGNDKKLLYRYYLDNSLDIEKYLILIGENK